mmetsp:Transcript_4830/g.15868  ORF Transcript_4830/g.15868 Transcript_4830/m.15868 type:complete len:226 (+) Transcript_4830:514-1191(+)
MARHLGSNWRSGGGWRRQQLPLDGFELLLHEALLLLELLELELELLWGLARVGIDLQLLFRVQCEGLEGRRLLHQHRRRCSSRRLVLAALRLNHGLLPSWEALVGLLRRHLLQLRLHRRLGNLLRLLGQRLRRLLLLHLELLHFLLVVLDLLLHQLHLLLLHLLLLLLQLEHLALDRLLRLLRRRDLEGWDALVRLRREALRHVVGVRPRGERERAVSVGGGDRP